MFGTFLPQLALRACRPGYDPADLVPHPDARALLDEALARFGEATPRNGRPA